MELSKILTRVDLSVMEKYISIYLFEFPNQKLLNLTKKILNNIEDPEEYQDKIKEKLLILMDKKIVEINKEGTYNICLDFASILHQKSTDKNEDSFLKKDEKTQTGVNIINNNIKKNNIKKNKNLSFSNSSSNSLSLSDTCLDGKHTKLGSVKRKPKNNRGDLFIRRMKLLKEEAKQRRVLELTNTLQSELTIKGLKFNRKWEVKSTQACLRLMEKHNYKTVSEALKWFLSNKYWSDKIDSFIMVESHFNKFILNRKESTILSSKDIIR